MPSMLDLSEPKHIHFIGIGGISMSALATIMLEKGWVVSGSDLRKSTFTDRLQASGAAIDFVHASENVDGADLVVFTSAVKPENPELMRARELAIPIYTRTELLGSLMAETGSGIAVAGAHGKTTTTAMLGLMLDLAGLDPTVLYGSELESVGSNVQIGNSEYLVTEACEYYENFLSLCPKIAIILNIDADHLDYFRGLEHIKQTFRRFAELVPEDGALIACYDDENVQSILPGLKCQVITYGLQGSTDWSAADIKLMAGESEFTLLHHNQPLARVKLRVPGQHNVLNSLSAIAVADRIGIPLATILQHVGAYHGTSRRFDYQGEYNGAIIYDDYAHHPTEVKATLAAARTFNPQRVLAVFQPHTYTRTKALMSDFSLAFQQADEVVITDIYAAREKDTYGVNSSQLAEAMQSVHPNTRHIPSLEQTTEFLREELRPGDLMITIGAGDVHRVADMLLQK